MRKFYMVVALLMTLSALMVWWVTLGGVGFNSDSASYVEAARSLEHGMPMMVPSHHGVAEPLRHWPPLYPAMLALAARGGEVLAAARWLDMLLFPLNILLLAGLALKLRLTPGPATYICLLFALAPVVLWAHVMAMSEAPALLYWLAGMWLLLEFQQRQKSWLLVLAASATAATAMTRYLGVAQILAGLPFVYFYTNGKTARKCWHAFSYAFIAALPLFAWFYSRRAASFGGAIGREIGFQFLAHSQIMKAMAAFTRWVVPFDGSGAIKLAFAVLIGAIFLAWMVLTLRQQRESNLQVKFLLADQAPVVLVAANLLACEAVIFAVALFIDPVMDLSERMHICAFACAVLLLGAGAGAYLRSEAGSAESAQKMCFYALAGFLLAAYCIAGALWIKNAPADHLDINSIPWRNLPGIALIQDKFNTGPIYSNYTDLIYLHTGRADVSNLPSTEKGTRNEANPNLAQETAAMLNDLAQHHGVIAYFKNFQTRMIPVDQLRKNPALRVVVETPDTVIFESAMAKPQN